MEYNELCTIQEGFYKLEQNPIYCAEKFEEILSQYSSMIHKVVYQLRIQHNKEDFFAEGRFALYEAYCNYHPTKGEFPAYAYATIRGRILNTIQREERMMPKDKLQALDLCPEFGQNPTESIEIRMFLHETFQTLSPSEQHLFSLVFLQDQPLTKAVKDRKVCLTYRQGKYMLQNIRQKFKTAWEVYINVEKE